MKHILQIKFSLQRARLLALFATFSLFLFFMGCTTDKLQSNPDSQPTIASTRTLEPTDLRSPTITRTSTSTKPPSPSPTPTKISLPVGNGTDIPDLDYEKLTSENISRIQPVAMYGSPQRMSVRPDAKNEKLFITTVDGISIFDTETKALLKEIETKIPFVTSYWSSLGGPQDWNMSISGNGELILLLNEHYDLELWDINGEKLWTKKMIWNFDQTNLKFNSISASISPDGSILAQSYCNEYGKCKIVLTNSISDEVIDEIDGFNPVFSGTGKYLTYISKNTVNFYKLDTKKISVGFSLKNYVWVIGNVGLSDFMYVIYWDHVDIWDITSRKKEITIDDFEPGWGENNLPRIEGISPSGKYFLISTYRYPQKLLTFDINGSVINETDFDSKKVYIINDTKQVRFMDVEQNEVYPENLYNGYYSPVRLIFTKHDLALFGKPIGHEWNGTNWDIVFPERLVCSKGICQSKEINQSSSYDFFMYNGKLIELYGGRESNQLELYIDGEKLSTISTSFYVIKILGITKDVMLFTSVGTRNAVFTYLVDISTGEVIRKWKNVVPRYMVGFSKNLIAFDLSSDGSNESHVYVFDTRTKQIVFDKSGHQFDLLVPLETSDSILFGRTSFDPNLERVSIKDNKTLVGAVYQNKFAFNGSIDDLARIIVTKDESLVALATIDGMIRIYSVEKDEFVFEWQAHMNSIYAIAFSDDGLFLASYSKDGYVTIWGIPRY